MGVKNKPDKARSIAEKVIFFAGLILLWQVLYWIFVTALSVWKGYSIPSPAGVASSLISLLRDGSLIQAIAFSILRGLIGYLIALVIGVFIGLLIYRFDFLNRNLRPLIMGVQTLPSICWVPFSILWFGLTERAIIFVVIMGSAFGMAIAVENAIKNVPPIYKKAALTMGANQKQLYTRVIFPASLPELISGFKQGWSFAWRALMSGEVMTTSISLGQTLITGRNLADINQVMLVMIIIILIGIMVDHFVFGLLEKRIRRSRGLD